MTFFEFLDNKFRYSAIELQKGYKVSVDAEMKAGQWLIKQQHRCYRWLSVPRLIFDFILIKVGLMTEPKKFEPAIYPTPVAVPPAPKVSPPGSGGIIPPPPGTANAEVLPK